MDKDEYLKQCRYEMAYCQHYLDQQSPGEAPKWAALTLGELPHQLTSATVESFPHAGEPTPLEGQDPQSNDDVEMQDDSSQGAVGSEGAPVEPALSARKMRPCSMRKKCKHLRCRSSVRCKTSQ